MNINEAYPGKYLKADVDVPEDESLIVVIERVEMETVGQGDDADHKPVVYFKGMTKGLVLNKTNAHVIAKVLGSPDTDDWEGRKIALFSTDVQFGADMVRAIRVRSKSPKAPKIAAPADDDSEQSPPAQSRGGIAGPRYDEPNPFHDSCDESDPFAPDDRPTPPGSIPPKDWSYEDLASTVAENMGECRPLWETLCAGFSIEATLDEILNYRSPAKQKAARPMLAAIVTRMMDQAKKVAA